MKPPEFFRRPEPARILKRAARCTVTPLAVHFFGPEAEGQEIVSHGQCAACKYLATSSRGKEACDRSREEHALTALRRQNPTPFVCHMGFACIVVPVFAERGQGYTLTFGPYCPAEEPRSLESAALRGLVTLFNSETGDAFPVSLADIRVVPVSAIPAIAEWTVEALAAVRDEPQEAQAQPPAIEEEAPESPKRRAKPHSPPPDPYQAAPIAMALAGGKQGQARALVRGTLSESRSIKRARIAVKRARCVAVVGAALEAAERAELKTQRCWDRFPEFVEEVRRARSNSDLTNAAMRLLGILKRESVRKPRHVDPPRMPQGADYVELNEIIIEGLPERVKISDAAAKLGVHPTTITHRLQRRFDMSYSQYTGRLRIHLAKQLLLTTQLSVTEVGRRIGIDDVSNFVKRFREFEHMTPAEYRDRYKDKE